jgi:tetratricopeptide (TPR) repeat protein
MGCFSKALRLKPNDVEILVESGNCLGRMKRPSEALEYFGRAARLDPAHAPAWRGLTASSFELGHHADTVAYSGHALELDPQDIGVWCLRVGALAELGQFDEALRCVDQALVVAPAEARLIECRRMILHGWSDDPQ